MVIFYIFSVLLSSFAMMVLEHTVESDPYIKKLTKETVRCMFIMALIPGINIVLTIAIVAYFMGYTQPDKVN